MRVQSPPPALKSRSLALPDFMHQGSSATKSRCLVDVARSGVLRRASRQYQAQKIGGFVSTLPGGVVTAGRGYSFDDYFITPIAIMPTLWSRNQRQCRMAELFGKIRFVPVTGWSMIFDRTSQCTVDTPS